MTEKLDTQMIIEAIEEINDVVTDRIYANWVGVFRDGNLLGFIIGNGMAYAFRPVNEEMRLWWNARTELDDENG